MPARRAGLHLRKDSGCEKGHKEADIANRGGDGSEPQIAQRKTADIRKIMKNAAVDYNYNRREADRRYEPKARKNVKAPPVKNDDDFHPVKPLITLTPAELRAIFVAVIIIAAIAMGIILLSAEAAMAQKEINNLKRGIARVDDDIANLKIEIEQSQNMQLIKIRAQEELGMKEPAFDQYVYVAELPVPESDFGRYIRERAYGAERRQTAEPEEEE